jgi:predicted permease
MLVTLQIALCLPLLVCAGLFVRTLQNLHGVDLGYPTQGLLQVSINTRAAGYEPARRDQLMDRLLAEVRQIPGVESVSFSHNGVFTGTNTGNTLRVDGFKSSNENDSSAQADFVAPEYFTTLRVPILAGRAISAEDQNSTARRVVVNETFVKHFFNGRNPIGQHFIVEATAGDLDHEIVGVAKDFRTHPNQLRRGVRPRYIGTTVGSYVGTRLRTNILIRVKGDAGPVFAAARSLVERADPTIAVTSARAVDDLIDPFLKDTRSMAQLATVFGIVALLLAVTGLYGVLSYGIARRTREIAIRMALGARPKGVAGMILRETSWVVVAGLVVGAGLAYAASRFLTSELFGVTPQDPVTSTLAIGTLLVAALVATLWPSYRASRMDPMTALRQE